MIKPMESTALTKKLRQNRQAGHCDIITHNAACWGDLPKPPNRMVNHAAARFFKTLMYPSGERNGTDGRFIGHFDGSFPVLYWPHPVAEFAPCLRGRSAVPAYRHVLFDTPHTTFFFQLIAVRILRKGF